MILFTAYNVWILLLAAMYAYYVCYPIDIRLLGPGV